jgi:hypothetical protein
VPAQIVPTFGDAFWTQTTSFDGTAYTLRFAFNQRAACFYLDIATVDGTPVVSGVKLVCNWSLLKKCASPLRPPGRLYVVSNTSDESPPGLSDLASTSIGGTGRCVLVYLPVANVLALGGSPNS